MPRYVRSSTTVIDNISPSGHFFGTFDGAAFLRDELARRESARREAQMLRSTRVIEQLTWTVTAATIGALVIALVALLFG